MEKSKKRLLVIAAGVVAVILVCVLLVGLLDGVWPWSGSIGGDYPGMPTKDNDSTAEETDGNTITGSPTGMGVGNDSTGNVGSGSNGTEETGASVGVETGSGAEDIMTNPDNKLVIDFDDLPS